MSGKRSGAHAPPLFIVGTGLVIVLSFFIFASVFQWLPGGYWRRYSKDTFFFDDFAVDTEAKFWLSGFISFANTLVNQWVRQNMVTWINNSLSDHKTPRSDLACDNDWYIYSSMYGYYTFTALAGTLNIFLALTSIWTLVFQVVATIIVTGVTTRRFLREKVNDCSSKRDHLDRSLDGVPDPYASASAPLVSPTEVSPYRARTTRSRPVAPNGIQRNL